MATVTVSGPPGARLWRGTFAASNFPARGEIEVFLRDLVDVNSYNTQAVLTQTGLFRKGEVSVESVFVVPGAQAPSSLSGSTSERETCVMFHYAANSTSTSLDLTFETSRPTTVGTAHLDLVQIEPTITSVDTVPVRSRSIVH